MRGFRILVALVVAGWFQMPAEAQQSRVAVSSAEARPELRAAQAVLARPVTVVVEGLSLKRAINVVAAAAGTHVQYRAELIDAYQQPVTMRFTALPLGAVLERLLANTQLHVVALPDGIVGLAASVMDTRHIASGTITGIVTASATGRPLRGAKVTLDGTSQVAETDERGRYHLPVISAGTYTITAKLLGYAKAVRTVMVNEAATAVMNVALDEAANVLEQVVVTGTVIQTELKAVPNAITVITARQIEERGITKINQLFRGDVPGLFSQNLGSNALLDEVTMFSRGATALPGSASAGALSATAGGITSPIKTYIDGVEMADPKYLSQIDPKSIERIEILTGPQASTIYGSNALNGVMQIFTKRGTASHPQVTLNLLSGWVENNFSSARTPQHDYSAQLNGIEGRLAYNAGGAWNYIGPWTPAKQTTRVSTFAGTRLEIPTTFGVVTTDATLRRSITQNQGHGSASQALTAYQETGWYRGSLGNGVTVHSVQKLTGQTLGLTVSYIPISWWSHELSIGQDASDAEARSTARTYRIISDTTLSLSQTHTDRHSLRYTTTARVLMSTLAQATVTLGADGWQSLISSMNVLPQTLTGSLIGATSVSRRPSHNTGSFLQTQLAVKDRLFLTYGLRAEWNPDFGEEAQPNYAPRYGVAYAGDFGPITAKLRASYGRSTRPPQPGNKVTVKASDINSSNSMQIILPDYGNYDYYLASPELGPEHQQGGEGGVELYWGTRSSLVVTRYNQTVDGLIVGMLVDSVRSFTNTPLSWDTQDADGYGYRYQYQNLNLAGLRNQGWELQGSIRVGSITTRGTYSWTKSRVLGVTPKYRSFFSTVPEYQPGATFDYLPEHTWALGTTYASAGTTVTLNMNGIGRLRNVGDDFSSRNLSSSIRLSQNRLNVSTDSYISFNSAYALADLTASHRVSSRVEGVAQIQNFADRYTKNDFRADFASIGRQGKVGVRIRAQ